MTEESKQEVMEELLSMLSTLPEDRRDVLQKLSKDALVVLREALWRLGIEGDPRPTRIRSKHG